MSFRGFSGDFGGVTEMVLKVSEGLGVLHGPKEVSGSFRWYFNFRGYSVGFGVFGSSGGLEV